MTSDGKSEITYPVENIWQNIENWSRVLTQSGQGFAEERKVWGYSVPQLKIKLRGCVIDRLGPRLKHQGPGLGQSLSLNSH